MVIFPCSIFDPYGSFLEFCPRLDPRVTRTPNRLIHAECSNHFSYQGRTFAAHVLNTDSGGINIFELKLTFELLTVSRQDNLFYTHERMFL